MIRLVGVVWSSSDRSVLDGVTLHARTGEMLVIEGERGAGKSTLMRISAALARPDQGEVWIGGREVTRLQRVSLPFVRRNIGFLAQEAPLMPGATARDELLRALELRGENRARAYDRAAGTLATLGIESLATRRTDSLSMGERRLVALARALVGDPPLLVLDDPAAGLAPRDAGQVLSVLCAHRTAGVTVIAATPEGAFATAAARAGARRVRLIEGRVVGGARPAAVESARRVPAVEESLTTARPTRDGRTGDAS